MEVVHHINRLLYQHDKVMLPGLGSFDSIYQPASINDFARTVYPPSRCFSFSSGLSDDDGVLAEFIAGKENIPVEKAKEKVAEFIKSIKETTERQGAVKMESIGNFSIDAGRKIQFSPEEKSNFLISAFGLSEITFKPIERKPPEEKPLIKPAPAVIATPVKKEETARISAATVSPKPAEQKKTEIPKKTEPVAAPVKKEEKKPLAEKAVPVAAVNEKITGKKAAETKATAAKQESKKKTGRRWMAVDGYFITVLLLAGLLVYQWQRYNIKISDLKQLTWEEVKNDFIYIGNNLKDWLQKDTAVAENKKNEETPLPQDSAIKNNEQEEINYAEPQNQAPENTDANSPVSVETEKKEEGAVNPTAPLSEKMMDTVKKSEEAKSSEPSAIQRISATPEADSSPSSYVIILGSFQEKENALKLMQKLQKQSYKAVILKSENGNYRVGIDSYDNEPAAKAQLEQIRAAIHPNAWILNQRGRI